MAKKTKRYQYFALGRMIGTAAGWDQLDTFTLMLFDFKPADGISFPAADTLCIDFTSGKANTFDAQGDVLSSHDVMLALREMAVLQ